MMKFSGHETFAIREGWLHKGLKLLIEEPELLYHEYVADFLGVGKNMSRSIRHWLEVTGLAERETGSGRQTRLKETELGQLIYERDRYFVDIGTWWALHVNLVAPQTQVYTWKWFFNTFTHSRFEKSMCINRLMRDVGNLRSRPPSENTIDRDVACLLQSYARNIPTEDKDPEDALECPFVELGLLSYFRSSEYYQVHQGEKEIPTHLLGYVLSIAFEESRTGKDTFPISVREAATCLGGPGRAFVLTSESLLSLALQAENADPNKNIQVDGLAGDRRIRIRRMQPVDWLRNHYDMIQWRDQHAA
ncbi:MAG: DUF4007 family protein [Gemmatimonadetes bacterium]|nr:DUF4007 family protein [Gemmatimonadota bacterium]